MNQYFYFKTTQLDLQTLQAYKGYNACLVIFISYRKPDTDRTVYIGLWTVFRYRFSEDIKC